jgi:carboxymethylenebutenolidase
MNEQTAPETTPKQQAMVALWDQHVMAEFAMHDVEAALATMTEDAHVYNLPTLMGGMGKEGVREFYSKYFVHQIPPDMELVPISRTIGDDQIVDEYVARFTHSVQLDFLLPGIPPTGKRVEIAVVGIIKFRDGKIAHEHLYWDQAALLVQMGMIDPSTLPVTGAESARRLVDPTVPLNELVTRGK